MGKHEVAEPMASEKAATLEIDRLENFIYEIRGQKVMLDAGLASVYGETTARLNQQVKRNQERFPGDFVFQLTSVEYQSLMLQIATSKAGRRGRRKLPYAFTEHGAIMASMVLNAERAVQMSVYVVRAFARMRALLGVRQEWVSALRSLEKELGPALPEPPKSEIGFHVKEACGQYTRRPS